LFLSDKSAWENIEKLSQVLWLQIMGIYFSRESDLNHPTIDLLLHLIDLGDHVDLKIVSEDRLMPITN
jgi:hypothetical protein